MSGFDVPPRPRAAAQRLGIAAWGIAPAHPQWQCGLRPFFTAATLTALAAMALWLGFLGFGLPLPAAALPPAQWHAQLLLVGMGLAAVSGFVLTAVPEFTASPAFSERSVRGLTLCWWAGLCASPWDRPWALALAALAWLALVSALLALLLPRLWRDAGRRHLSLAWGVAALGLCIAGWSVELLHARPAGHWLDALLSAYMVLMVLAMSRISMRIVNAALDAFHAGRGTVAPAPYLARPPRRNLAVALIAAQAAVHWAWPQHAAGGWLALAAAAAMLHLMGDWHVGAALLRRWPLMLYAVYAAMALGYAALGGGRLLQDSGWTSAGRHVLAIGAFGLGIYAVFTIAGRAHVGLPPERGRWVPMGAGLLVMAALLRAAAAWGVAPGALLPASSLCWLAAFSLVLWRLVPLWQRPRADGRRGCDGPMDDGSSC